MITVTYAKSGANEVRVAIPEGKDPFEVVERMRREMFPDSKLREKDPAFDAIVRERITNPIDLRPIEERLGKIHEPPKQTVEERTTDMMTEIESSREAPAVTGKANGGGPAVPEARSLPLAAAGVRDTSMEAYAELKRGGKLGEQKEKVVAVWLGRERELFTRQEIARDAGLSINATCGRVAELLDGPLARLVEVGKKVCSVTKNNVNALGLASEHPRGG